MLVKFNGPDLFERLTLRRCLYGAALLLISWWLIFFFNNAAAAASAKNWVIDKAELNGLAGRRAVALPDVLEAQDFLPQGSRVRYRMVVQLPEAPVTPLGVFVSKMSLSGALYINGQFISSCDQGRLEELRCLHKPNLFSTPVSVWQAGDNILEFEIYANARQTNGLSPVQIGDLEDLYENSYRLRQWFKIEFLVGLGWISAVFGLLSLAVYFILRKELAYLWFGLACLAHAIAMLNLTVSHPMVSVDLFIWVVFTSRLFASPMAVLTMLSLFEKLQRWMVVALLSLAVFGPVVIGMSGVYRPLFLFLLLLLLIAGVSLVVSAIRWALQSRSPLKIITIGMSVVLVVSGITDWMRLVGRTEFEGSFLFPYTYSAMLVTLGTLLIRNLATSLKQSREDRAQLERRAAERMAYEVTENIPVGTYTLIYRPSEKRGNFLFVSQRFLELTGLPRKELLVDPNLFLNILHVDAWANWQQFITTRPGDRQKFSKEFRIFPVGGEMRWVSTEAVSRVLPDGSVVFEGVLFDQTQVVKAKEESERAREALQNQQIEQSRMKEREQLMRDMHDGFGSQLAAVRMMAEKGRIRPEQFPDFLREITSDLHLVVDTLGQLHITLEEALVDMHHRLERRFVGSGPTLHWKTRLTGLPPLAPRKILQALRLVQEALNNAFKHAHAKHVWFSAQFDVETDVLTLSVRDDGQGMLLSAARGRGLSNMQHRAREMGGEFQLIEHQPGVEVLLKVQQVSLKAHQDSK